MIADATEVTAIHGDPDQITALLHLATLIGDTIAAGVRDDQRDTKLAEVINRANPTQENPVNISPDAIAAAKDAANYALHTHTEDATLRKTVAEIVVNTITADDADRTPVDWFNLAAGDKEGRADYLRQVLAATRGKEFASNRRFAADRAISAAAAALAQNLARD